MVHLPCVAQFVDEHVVDELERQRHQRDIQADGAARATAPPPCRGVRVADPGIAEAVALCQDAQTDVEVDFGFLAQELDDGLADFGLDKLAIWLAVMGYGNGNLAFAEASRKRIPGLQTQAMALAYRIAMPVDATAASIEEPLEVLARAAYCLLDGKQRRELRRRRY